MAETAAGRTYMRAAGLLKLEGTVGWQSSIGKVGYHVQREETYRRVVFNGDITVFDELLEARILLRRPVGQLAIPA